MVRPIFNSIVELSIPVLCGKQSSYGESNLVVHSKVFMSTWELLFSFLDTLKK